MKKQLKLKKWVKVVITLILLVIGITVYAGLGNIGSDAVSSQVSGFLCGLGWGYLIFGQTLILANLWEN